MLELRARSAPEEAPEVEARPRATTNGSPQNADEAFAALTALARRKTGAIPAELLARHALAVGSGGDWPVVRAAMDAILRRVALRVQDGLRVARRPGRARPFGDYATSRRAGGGRPYAIRLDGIAPLRASCDCDDFVRNSLGLCKHVVAVLEDLASKRRFAAWARETPAAAASARLDWDPVRPLTGPGEWLAGVRYVPASNGPDSGGHGRVGAPPPALLRWFRPGGGQGGELVARDVPRDPARRRAFVDALAALGRDRVAVSPAVAALLREERRRQAAGAAWERDRVPFRRALRTLRRRLYPYQVEGVDRFLSTGALLLADDMGLGKTAQAIASCHALWHTGKVRRGLLVVPASLKPQWLREWSQFSDAPCRIVEGSQAQRVELYAKTRAGFLVANYEQVLRDLDAMRAWGPEAVVLDEAQRIKNWATKTAVYVKRLEPSWRLVLTGTPMENRLQELSSILDWVDDRALEPIWRLGPWHAVQADGEREVVGARNLDTLRERLSGCMLRRLRREVLTQLPPRTDTRVPVEITDEQREEHDVLNQPIAKLVGIARARPLTQAQFLRLMSLFTTQRIIANGLAQARFPRTWPEISRIRRPDEAVLKGLSSPKLLEFREIVAQVALGQGRKTVVFSQWRRMLALSHWAVAGLLEDAGLRAAFFTGAESPKQRTRNIVDFHDDPAVRVLFATDAGGVGLNLQRAASCCVNLELPWNPAVLEQRIGRIYRLGQTRPIDVYSLVSQGSIEARIADLVGDKRALFTGLFDGESDEIRFEGAGSFLSRIESIVPPAPVPEAAPEEEPAPDRDVVGEDEIDSVVAGADETGEPVPDVPASASGAAGVLAAAAASPAGVRGLFSRLAVHATDDGGLRLEAPADAAASLAALFEGMAALLRSAAPPRQVARVGVWRGEHERRVRARSDSAGHEPRPQSVHAAQ